MHHAGTTEVFKTVVVATGRFQSPAIPSVPGVVTFAGSAGVISTYQYRDPARALLRQACTHRGRRLESITNTAVTFADGNVEEFDGIVFGTGSICTELRIRDRAS